VEKRIFGRTIAHTWVVEYQKRGLPHAHMLVFLAPEDKPRLASNCDEIVSAELPDSETDPELFDLVKKFMIHRKCQRNSMCFSATGCTKGFPKPYNESKLLQDDGYVLYRRRNLPNRSYIHRGHRYDNQWVVPYNPYLLKR
jgi:hypothetical protein